MAAYLAPSAMSQYADPLTIARLTDDERGEVIDDVRVQSALDSASALIDGFLQQRYRLPLRTACEQLCVWNAHLALYELYLRRADGADLPDAVVRMRKDAISLLERVAKGTFSLAVQEAPAPISVAEDEKSRFRLRSNKPSLTVADWQHYES